MSRTAFIHEIQEDGRPSVLVTLTLDSAEATALGEVAGVAVDASVLLADMVPPDVLGNAEAILAWASRSAIALNILENGPARGEE